MRLKSFDMILSRQVFLVSLYFTDFLKDITQNIEDNPFNPKYLEWYSPYLYLDLTIQVCRGDKVKEYEDYSL